MNEQLFIGFFLRLYFRFCLQVYAEAIGSRIEPAEYAVAIKQTEVEIDVKKLPAQNPHLKGNLQTEPEIQSEKEANK